MSLQKLITGLQDYWAERGCYIASGYDTEVGAGTMTPDTFFRVLGRRPWRSAYWQPSRRPDDGRYGQNPNRVQKHNQFQVILKPAPADGQALYLDSLVYIGVDIATHNIKFEEDDWASPSLGAWGIGWQVDCDGLEITQFTYFQQAGGIDLEPNSLEITYGLERLAMFLDQKAGCFDLDWGNGFSYRDLRYEEERQFSVYNFEAADIDFLRNIFNLSYQEAERLVQQGLFLPAYDYLLKCSHAFNVLDARKAFSITERTTLIGLMRSMSGAIARKYIDWEERDANA